MVDRELNIIIRTLNQARQGIRDNIAALRRMGGIAARVSRGLRRLGTGIARAFRRGAIAATAFAATAIGISANFVKAASDAEETAQKFEVVFENVGDAAERAAKDLAENFGLASTSAKKLLGDTGDILVGFGFTEEKALELALSVNKLAVDLASFTNVAGGAELASKALTSALVGETERAKALGIVIRQDSREFTDFVENAQRAEGLSLLQAKALSALNIATKQSTKAQGDFARTQNTVANRLRIMGQALKDAREEIGRQIITGTGLEDVLGNIITKIRVFTDNLVQSKAVEEWAKRAKTAIDTVIDTVEKLLAGGAQRQKVLEEFKAIGIDFAASAENILRKFAPEFGELIARGFIAGVKGTGRTVGAIQAEARAQRIRADPARGGRVGPALEVARSVAESVVPGGALNRILSQEGIFGLTAAREANIQVLQAILDENKKNTTAVKDIVID